MQNGGNRKNKNRNFRKHRNNPFFTKLLYLGAILLSFFFLINTVRSIQLTLEKLEILKQAEIDVEELRLTNIELIQFDKLVKSDFYVELEGRDRLHLSQEDEFVVIIDEDILNSYELDIYYQTFLPKENLQTLETGFDVWIKFFTNGI